MQRLSLTAEIFGYLVCLFAVVVFFCSVAGVVNNAFRVVNPSTGHRQIMVRTMGPIGPMGPGRRGRRAFWMGGGGPGPVVIGAAPMGQVPKGMPSPPVLPKGFDVTTMRANATADARFDASRRLVLAIVMLILSILVFRRAFTWLNPLQRTTT